MRSLKWQVGISEQRDIPGQGHTWTKDLRRKTAWCLGTEKTYQQFSAAEVKSFRPGVRRHEAGEAGFWTILPGWEMRASSYKIMMMSGACWRTFNQAWHDQIYTWKKHGLMCDRFWGKGRGKSSQGVGKPAVKERQWSPVWGQWPVEPEQPFSKCGSHSHRMECSSAIKKYLLVNAINMGEPYRHYSKWKKSYRKDPGYRIPFKLNVPKS